WDDLLHADAAGLLPPAPGTVSVAVRHPQRPRETYTPQLLEALRRLDKAQQLAGRRRLFYVAATRAKERLILVGKDGSLPRTCWQRWFEAALGLTDEHKEAGRWKDSASGYSVHVITQGAAPEVAAESPAGAITAGLCLEAIEE